MAAILIALMLVAAASAASVDRCPSHLPRNQYLKAYENFCYRFHLHDVREYYNARRTCLNEGGILAMPKTNETDWFIALELHYTFKYPYLVWIGLNDKHQESVFRWEDGSILHPSDYSDWGYNEGPSHIFGGWENCVAINPQGRYKWTDIQCSGLIFDESHAFVCQFDAVQDIGTSDAPWPSVTTTKPTTPETTTETVTTTKPVTSLPTTIKPTTPQPTTTKPTTPQPTTTKPTTPQPTTTKPTTPQPTTTIPTNPQPTTTKPTTPQSTTTKPTTPQPTTPVPITPITEGCPPFDCGLDCGMDGYALNKATGCPICQCNV